MINALQLTTPDVGSVSRSMLGVLAVVAVAVASGFSVGRDLGRRRGGDRRRDSPAGQPRRTGAARHRGVAANGCRRAPWCTDRVLQRGIHRRRRGVLLRGRHAVGAGKQCGLGRCCDRCTARDLAAGCALCDRGGVVYGADGGRRLRAGGTDRRVAAPALAGAARRADTRPPRTGRRCPPRRRRPRGLRGRRPIHVAAGSVRRQRRDATPAGVSRRLPVARANHRDARCLAR